MMAQRLEDERAEPMYSAGEGPHQQEEHQQADQQPPRHYSLPGLDGQWTLQQLVDMEMEHDPRLAQVLPLPAAACRLLPGKLESPRWHPLLPTLA